jgi:integration host factor subunit beta
VAITKAKLIELVAARAKLSSTRAESAVNQIFDSMADALTRGEGIELRGFGCFSIRSYGAYEGRNPRHGQPIHVKAKRLAIFKVGKQLRQRVHAGRFVAWRASS